MTESSSEAPGFLNDAEFYQQALAGGASRHAFASNVPDRGYMVGQASDLANQPMPEQQYPVEQFSVDHVRHHAREIKERFGADSGVHQGAWREGDNIVFDASQQIPTYSSAISAAQARGERAIYDVRRGRDLHTHDAKVVN